MQAKYMLNCINIVYSFNPIMIAQEQKNLGIPFGNLQVIFKANTLYIQVRNLSDQTVIPINKYYNMGLPL